jgi:hypothetical protein
MYDFRVVCFLPLNFPIKIMYGFLISHTRAACPAHLIVPNFHSSNEIFSCGL